MKTKQSTIKFSKFINKDEFKNIFDEFQSQHGYMTKLFDKTNEVNYNPMGYIMRAEIPGYPGFIALTYINANEYEYEHGKCSQRFIKAIGINKVLTGGQRKLKSYEKQFGSLAEFKSESILDEFKPVDRAKKEYPEELIAYYIDLLDYIKAFENKIKKYYNGENIKIVVIK